MSTFKFKQFEIQQDQCAMKVSLDACVLGALCEVKQAQHILDIGAGTGLLSLMLAQRAPTDAKITAMELDLSAFQQASCNISNSPFSESINLIQGDIKAFNSPQKFDVIICNPPFFTQQLKGQDPQRNLARHNDGLSFDELGFTIKRLLEPQGAAWILLPTNELERFEKAAKKANLSIQNQWQVFSLANKPAKICVFSLVHDQEFEPEQRNTQTLTVYDDHKEYSAQFAQLLKDYYLKL